jgi:hypothetical protein
MGSQTLHIFALGYEERCLAYARALSDSVLSGKHKFLCVVPPDEHVSWFLKSVRRKHQDAILQMLPGTHFGSWDDLKREISDLGRWETCCLDISSLPRTLIFSALGQMLATRKPGRNLFVLYTFPAQYAYGPLQSPAADVTIHFTDPQLRVGETTAAYVIPGFDVEYTNLALAYMKGATQRQPHVTWLLAFPGRKYAFYERALERHIELISDSKVSLFPQDEIALALKELEGAVEAAPAMPVYFVPLGSRINCVSVFLAAVAAKKKGKQVNILYPRTLRHSSIRSTGFTSPLIERIPDIPSEDVLGESA